MGQEISVKMRSLYGTRRCFLSDKIEGRIDSHFVVSAVKIIVYDSMISWSLGVKQAAAVTLLRRFQTLKEM